MSAMPQSENCTRKNESTHSKQQIMIVLQIKWAFWVPIYLKTLVLFCRTFGTQPDPLKVAQTARKGIKVMLPQSQNQKGFKAVLVRLLFPFSDHGGWGKSLRPFR